MKSSPKAVNDVFRFRRPHHCLDKRPTIEAVPGPFHMVHCRQLLIGLEGWNAGVREVVCDIL